MKEINIGGMLVGKRREKGVTQEELAEYVGVSKASVSKWETGLCYPDITLLPQLAAYFNVSIDELMNYTPQMTKEDIDKLYRRLAKRFAEVGFSDVLGECRLIIKKYYSCFPLLYRLGLLLVNHHVLAEGEEEKREILREVIGLCERVKEECDDVWLAKDAVHLQAICYCVLQEPGRVLELLGEEMKPIHSGELLISNAYQMMGNGGKAKEILQISIYNYVGALYGALLNYMNLCGDDLEKSEEIMGRAFSLSESFGMEKLNPVSASTLYIQGALMYCGCGEVKKALGMLKKYADVWRDGIFSFVLQGDDFFDRIGGWLSELDMGGAAPRSEQLIRESMFKEVLAYPGFDVLKDEPEYREIVRKFEKFSGGK